MCLYIHTHLIFDQYILFLFVSFVSLRLNFNSFSFNSEFNPFIFNVIIVVLRLALPFYIVSFQCLNLISVSSLIPVQ